MFADPGSTRGDIGTDLPQGSELPLFDAQQLRELTGDDGGMSGGVVQDRLPKSCSSPQGADDNSILKQRINPEL